MDRFENRREAGLALAEFLRDYTNAADTLVLALPRGGVPVGYELARALNLPLDVFVVRKLGVPGYEELAMGAIASGGVRVLNADVIRRVGVSEGQIEDVTRREQAELERREIEYRGDRPALNVEGKTIILTDDGLATGATMRAAAQALYQAGARRIIVGVPVGSIETVRMLERDVHTVACPLQPQEFHAVGAWYEDFSQTTDGEVRELLGDSVHA